LSDGDGIVNAGSCSKFHCDLAGCLWQAFNVAEFTIVWLKLMSAPIPALMVADLGLAPLIVSSGGKITIMIPAVTNVDMEPQGISIK